MNPKIAVTTLSGVLGAGLIIGAVVLRSSGKETLSSSATPPKVVSQSTKDISRSALAAADGRGGRDCYVAIDKVVYEIKDSPVWINGQHVTSQGRASCGRDLSKVIDKAPHGRKILETLTKVGRLTD